MWNARALIHAGWFIGAALAVACGSSSDSPTATGGSSNQSGSSNANGGSSSGSNAGNANQGGSNSTAGNASGGTAGAGNGGSSTGGAGNAGNPSAGNGNAGSGNGGNAGSTGGGASGGSAPGSEIGSDFLCKPQCTDQQYCAIVVDDCGHKPCLVHAECRAVPSCTAANGYACPTTQSRCIDDGVANCSTTTEGKKCDGHCLCKQQASCGDQVFDAQPNVCGCVPAMSGFKSCLEFQCPDGYRCNQALGTYLCVSPT